MPGSASQVWLLEVECNIRQLPDNSFSLAAEAACVPAASISSATGRRITLPLRTFRGWPTRRKGRLSAEPSHG